MKAWGYERGFQVQGINHYSGVAQIESNPYSGHLCELNTGPEASITEAKAVIYISNSRYG